MKRILAECKRTGVAKEIVAEKLYECGSKVPCWKQVPFGNAIYCRVPLSEKEQQQLTEAQPKRLRLDLSRGQD